MDYITSPPCDPVEPLPADVLQQCIQFCNDNITEDITDLWYRYVLFAWVHDSYVAALRRIRRENRKRSIKMKFKILERHEFDALLNKDTQRLVLDALHYYITGRRK